MENVSQKKKDVGVSKRRKPEKDQNATVDKANTTNTNQTKNNARNEDPTFLGVTLLQKLFVLDVR